MNNKYDSFVCRVCGAEVTSDGAGTQNRNHCPNCLSSVHLDIVPGDRAADCGGIMEPIGVWVRKNGEALPEKPVIVTFDDGYYNVMEYALPFMRENGIKGVINIVGAYSEQSFEEGGHNPAYSYLTWEDISELDKSGVFEIGNHTYDMHSLNGRKGCRRLYSENAEEYRTALFEDTGGLQDILEEKSGVRPVTFAYPFGFISDESTDILEEIGFKVLLTCYEKPNYISRGESGKCLILNRYNRPSGTETEKFFEKILSGNEKHENK